MEDVLMADSPLPTFSPTNGDSPSSPTNQGPNHPFAPSSSANYSLNSPPGNGVGLDGGGDVSLNMNMNGGDVDVNGLDMGIEDILAQFGLPPMSVMGTSHEPHHLQHQQQPQQQQHEHVQRQQHQQHQQQAAGVATGKVTPGGTGKGTPQSSHAPSPLNLQNSTSADSPGRIGRPSSRASSLLQSVHGNANAEHGGVNVAAGHYRSSSASSSRSSGANLAAYTNASPQLHNNPRPQIRHVNSAQSIHNLSLQLANASSAPNSPIDAFYARAHALHQAQHSPQQAQFPSIPHQQQQQQQPHQQLDASSSSMNPNGSSYGIPSSSQAQTQNQTQSQNLPTSNPIQHSLSQGFHTFGPEMSDSAGGMNMGRMRDSSVGGGGSARMGTQTGSSVLETTDDGYRDSDLMFTPLISPAMTPLSVFSSTSGSMPPKPAHSDISNSAAIAALQRSFSQNGQPVPSNASVPHSAPARSNTNTVSPAEFFSPLTSPALRPHDQQHHQHHQVSQQNPGMEDHEMDQARMNLDHQGGYSQDPDAAARYQGLLAQANALGISGNLNGQESGGNMPMDQQSSQDLEFAAALAQQVHQLQVNSPIQGSSHEQLMAATLAAAYGHHNPYSPIFTAMGQSPQTNFAFGASMSDQQHHLPQQQGMAGGHGMGGSHPQLALSLQTGMNMVQPPSAGSDSNYTPVSAQNSPVIAAVGGGGAGRGKAERTEKERGGGRGRGSSRSAPKTRPSPIIRPVGGSSSGGRFQRRPGSGGDSNTAQSPRIKAVASNTNLSASPTIHPTSAAAAVSLFGQGPIPNAHPGPGPSASQAPYSNNAFPSNQSSPAIAPSASSSSSGKTGTTSHTTPVLHGNASSSRSALSGPAGATNSPSPVDLNLNSGPSPPTNENRASGPTSSSAAAGTGATAPTQQQQLHHQMIISPVTPASIMNLPPELSLLSGLSPRLAPKPSGPPGTGYPPPIRPAIANNSSNAEAERIGKEKGKGKRTSSGTVGTAPRSNVSSPMLLPATDSANSSPALKPTKSSSSTSSANASAPQGSYSRININIAPLGKPAMSAAQQQASNVAKGKGRAVDAMVLGKKAGLKGSPAGGSASGSNVGGLRSPGLKPILPTAAGLPPDAMARLSLKSNYQNIMEGRGVDLLGLDPKTINAMNKSHTVGLESRRTSHKAAEQKRRDSLKLCFEELRRILPPIPLEEDEDAPILKRPGEGSVGGLRGVSIDPNNPNKGVSKVALLRRSNEYIIKLHRRLDKRDNAIDILRERVRELRKRLGDEVDEEDPLDGIGFGDLDADEGMVGGYVVEGGRGREFDLHDVARSVNAMEVCDEEDENEDGDDEENGEREGAGGSKKGVSRKEVASRSGLGSSGEGDGAGSGEKVVVKTSPGKDDLDLVVEKGTDDAGAKEAEAGDEREREREREDGLGSDNDDEAAGTETRNATSFSTRRRKSISSAPSNSSSNSTSASASASASAPARSSAKVGGSPSLPPNNGGGGGGGGKPRRSSTRTSTKRRKDPNAMEIESTA